VFERQSGKELERHPEGGKASRSTAGDLAVVDVATFDALAEKSTHGCVGLAACAEGRRMRIAEPVLGLVVFFGFQLAGEVQPQLAESSAQGVPRNPQQARGLMLIRPGVLQDAGQQKAVHLAVRFRIQVT
jgi:hypothetical protein